MVYSNAIYFALEFDKLTDEVLSSFRVKQKIITKKVQARQNQKLMKSIKMGR
jgi:hypothetical protein